MGQVVARTAANDRGICELVIDVGADFPAGAGDSIAVNGCCLTLMGQTENRYHFEVSRETLDKTDLGFLQLGSTVNLERAVRLADRLGGHLVTGHVDGVAKIDEVQADGDGWLVRVAIPKPWHRLMIPKGSVTLAGVSLTINAVRDTDAGCQIDLMLIPTTLQVTTLGGWQSGVAINFEADMIGKYVQRLTETKPL